MKYMRLLFCVFLLLPASLASAADIEIEQFELDNGLKVIVLPNHRIPAVSHMLWFPSGGADDPAGKSGLAHFHEHVMFKGTPNYAAGEFESIISKLGGDHNAFTSYDTTGYYVNIPKSALPKIMELEADRIRGIVPSDEDILKERSVILEERQMRIENNPRGLFDEQLKSLLFVHHPYGTPLIGWLHEMEKLSKEDVVDFHKRYYTVNNATLILAGDITAEEVKPVVQHYYGGLEKGEPYVNAWSEEPPFRADKSFVMRHPQVTEPSWKHDYIAPSYGYGEKKHVVPLMVFAQWLGGGNTSYLYQELVVKQKLATSVYASYSGFSIGPETFTIGAVPANGVGMEKLEAAIDKALKKALITTPDAEDVARAKTILKAETLYAQEGLQGIAYIVGWLTMLGLEPNYVNEWADLVEKAETSAMWQAAKAVFNGTGSVTGALLPEGGAE